MVLPSVSSVFVSFAVKFLPLPMLLVLYVSLLYDIKVYKHIAVNPRGVGPPLARVFPHVVHHWSHSETWKWPSRLKQCRVYETHPIPGLPAAMGSLMSGCWG